MKGAMMMRFPSYVAGAAVVAALLQGCSTVSDIPYHAICEGRESCEDSSLQEAVSERTNIYINNFGWRACLAVDKEYFSGNADLISTVRCSESAISTSRNVPFHQAWLEYSADGTPHNLWQHKAILRWINTHRGPLHVVVYIHGWHNNGDAAGGDPRNNAIKFPFMVARHVDALRRLHISDGVTVPDVLAVYVGWPGEKYRNNPLLSLLSIDSRSKVADKIGEAGNLKSDLVAISEAVGISNSLDRKLFVMGHSLGGRVLTSAFANDLASGNAQPLGQNSLVVTVNAAVGADCFDSIFGEGGINKPGARPAWVNLTNEEDAATRYIYRFASMFGLVGSCRPQSPASGKTIGHYRPYIRQSLTKVMSLGQHALAGCPRVLNGEAGIQDGKMSEIAWFRTPGKLFLTFPYREGSAFDLCDADHYSIEYALERSVDNRYLSDTVWNVRSDEGLIDFDHGGGGVNGHHNGYVATIPTRLLIEMLYSR